MITISSLELPPGIAWTDEYSAQQPIAQTARRRLSGALTIFELPLEAGRAITLEATPDSPITRAQADALAQLAAVPGATYALQFNARDPVVTFTVMFRHHEPPPLDLRPMIDYADPSDTDWVVGQIKLLTV